MPTKQSKLQLILEAIDKNLSATLKRVGGGLDELSAKGSSTQKAMQNTGLALTALGAGGTAFLFSATKLAARVETLDVVVNQLGTTAGYSKEQLRGFENSIKDQGITLQKTRQAMAMMMQTQIDLTHGTKLAALAQNTAVIANLDSSESFQRLIAVIQTGNIRMGRGLGLQLQFGKAQQNLAKELGITTDELTEQQIIQSRLNEVLRAGEPIMGTYDAAMETAGKKVLSLNRHIEESRRIIGEAYLPLFADIVDGITMTLQKFEDMNAGQQRGIATALGMATAWATLGGAGLILVSQLSTIAANMKIVGLTMSTSLGPISLVVTAIAALTTVLISAKAASKAAHAAYEKGEKQARESAKTYKEYQKQVREVAEVEGLVLTTEEELRQQLIEGNEARNRHNRTTAYTIDVEEQLQRAREDQIGIVFELTEAEWRLHQIMLGEQSDWAQMAELYDEAGNRLESTLVKVDKFADVLIDEATAADKARDANKKFLDGLDRSIDSPMADFIKDVEWYLATGGQFEAAYGRIIALAKSHPEETASLMQELIVVTIDAQEEMGMISGDEAAQKIADTLGVTLDEAYERIAGTDGLQEALAGMGDIYIDLGELERMEDTTLRILQNLNLMRTPMIGVGVPGAPYDPGAPSPPPGGPSDSSPPPPSPMPGPQQDVTVNLYPEVVQEMDVYEMAYTTADIIQGNRR